MGRRIVLLAAALGVVTAGPAAAQIPQDQYLRYMPLRYPRIVRQTTANERFHLYGDTKDPAYRDADPVDGIDDARGRRLTALAVRFAPIMVRNSSQFPMDFRALYDMGPFPIFLERWDIARADFSLVDSTTVDMAKLAGAPCPPGGNPANDDCRLQDLIARFGPERAPLEPEVAARAEQEIFSVMHFDLPGFDEKTWKEEYGPRNRAKYIGAARTFVHPFIAEVPSPVSGSPSYELVLQYWFFYPANDGPNNHEGDWEHLNVVVSPLSQVHAPLNEAGIEALLSGTRPLEGSDPVVLRRIEYYLHHFVTTLDFTSPNAYQPRADWQREVDGRQLQASQKRLVERVRGRAWRDAAESAINTRPIVWIGGDAIGIQNVLQMPGLKDRDGHASYPYRGYYKQIGAGGVGERVLTAFDPLDYFANPNGDWDQVEDYGTPERLALTPDWERVIEPVRTNPTARRDWSWMLLPLRFGYPASPSPAAGIVAHADTGNVSVVGPTYNDGWNRLGDSAGYEAYEVVETSWATPLSLTDSFFPRVGFLNAPIIYFMLKPPLDLIWRTVALPVRAAAGSRQPTFQPASAPAIRSVSLEVGPMVTDLNNDLAALFFSREQLKQIIALSAVQFPDDTSGLRVEPHFGWAVAPAYSLVFHLMPRLSAESAFLSYSEWVGFDWAFENAASIPVRGRYHQTEYHGNTRFNILTGRFQPYVKIGSGITWFQLTDVNVNGVLLPDPDSPTFKPKSGWRSLGFNETVLGGGADWSRLRLGRVWIGGKLSYTWIHNGLGFERDADVENFPAVATALAGQTYSVWRQQFRALATVGF